MTYILVTGGAGFMGTFTLIETARRHWMEGPGKEKARFHHISTDEVYGIVQTVEWYLNINGEKA